MSTPEYPAIDLSDGIDRFEALALIDFLSGYGFVITDATITEDGKIVDLFPEADPPRSVTALPYPFQGEDVEGVALPLEALERARERYLDDESENVRNAAAGYFQAFVWPGMPLREYQGVSGWQYQNILARQIALDISQVQTRGLIAILLGGGRRVFQAKTYAPDSVGPGRWDAELIGPVANVGCLPFRRPPSGPAAQGPYRDEVIYDQDLVDAIVLEHFESIIHQARQKDGARYEG